MHIHSDSFGHRGPLPAEFALGTPAGFGGNRNPHLAWDDAPAGTRSFVLMCVDTDAPTDPATVGRDDMDIPVTQPRTHFVHWVMADVPAGVRELAAGSCSDGFEQGGKRAPRGPGDSQQGRNDYTGWFANDAAMAGDYLGYDGAYPPANDLQVHRYFFRVFALDVARLALPPGFTAGDAFRAMHGHVLAETAIHATYSLHA